MAQKMHSEIEKILIRTILTFVDWLAFGSDILLNDVGKLLFLKLGIIKREEQTQSLSVLKKSQFVRIHSDKTVYICGWENDQHTLIEL